MGTGDSYLKHRKYVGNVSSTFPKVKLAYDGKYMELDFSQNLALQPKDGVQSAHSSQKHFTLNYAIVDPVKYRYHLHLSDNTNHDGIFVDHVIRDIIDIYDIKKEDLGIQSDNAYSQYKNKDSFFVPQKLAKDFIQSKDHSYVRYCWSWKRGYRWDV